MSQRMKISMAPLSPQTQSTLGVNYGSIYTPSYTHTRTHVDERVYKCLIVADLISTVQWFCARAGKWGTGNWIWYRQMKLSISRLLMGANGMIVLVLWGYTCVYLLYK